ncbi:hypothetical protein CEXT_697821 [Caerostris extrusa]|uniref:Uncharacterized protein n=1 Tax=Caerostris extrusa TaxID=172846 RepID=A0AAV4VZ78_CAEEX|nr:hypothetical protein CEXT_697821 [Caerostris extrusa]
MNERRQLENSSRDKKTFNGSSLYVPAHRYKMDLKIKYLLIKGSYLPHQQCKWAQKSSFWNTVTICSFELARITSVLACQGFSGEK